MSDDPKLFFICTRCNKSLKLDQSFDVFSEEDICGLELAKYDRNQDYTNVSCLKYISQIWNKFLILALNSSVLNNGEIKFKIGSTQFTV